MITGRALLAVPVVVVAFAACAAGEENRRQRDEIAPAAQQPPVDEVFDDGEGPGEDGCPPMPRGWRAMTPDPASGTRIFATTASPVWTGSEALFLRSHWDESCACWVVGAAAYSVAKDAWREDMPAGPPVYNATSFWTGSEWILWGGSTWAGLSGALDGFAYSPKSNTWSYVEPAPLSERMLTAAAWAPRTRELVVWGGYAPGTVLSDGAAYNVETRTWRKIAASPLGARYSARAAYDGRGVVFAFGFRDVPAEREGHIPLDGAAEYDPVTDTWTMLPIPPIAPRTRESDLTIGAKSDLAAFWGGLPLEADGQPPYNDGAAWSSGTASWLSIPNPAFEGGNRRHVTSWSGDGKLFVWGGLVGEETAFDDGASFDPATRAWTRLPPGGPSPRIFASAVWTGCDAIVYGGEENNGRILRP